MILRGLVLLGPSLFLNTAAFVLWDEGVACTILLDLLLLCPLRAT